MSKLLTRALVLAAIMSCAFVFVDTATAANRRDWRACEALDIKKVLQGCTKVV